MDQSSNRNVSPIRTHAADALRRARKLPVGHDRNDLRQLAIGLLWLEKRGFVAIAQDGATALRECENHEVEAPSVDLLPLCAVKQTAPAHG